MSMAYVGDEVFFHHKGVPKVGKVKSVGKHGCVVSHGDDEHRLKWGHVRGHKSRVPQNYKALDVGEDGMIVENAQGMRRFICIPSESKDSYTLAPQS